jgi:hypothetical protein
MIEYSSITKVLPVVMSNVRSNDTESQMLSYALKYYRLLNIPVQHKETIGLFQIVNHKVNLPDAVKNINLVTCSTYFEEEEATTYCDTDAEVYTDTGDTSITVKLAFYESDAYKEFVPLKYIQGSVAYSGCKHCLNKHFHHCNDTFSVDHNKTLWSSIESGWICISYMSEIKENGNYIIVNTPEILQYLARGVELDHFINRSYGSTQGALGLADRLQQKVDINMRSARGSINRRLINLPLINEITVRSVNNTFFKVLPDVYRAKYEPRNAY